MKMHLLDYINYTMQLSNIPAQNLHRVQIGWTGPWICKHGMHNPLDVNLQMKKMYYAGKLCQYMYTFRYIYQVYMGPWVTSLT